MYIIGLFLSTGAGWACGIPSVFTQIYLCFSAAEDFFSAMLDWGGLCLHPVLPVAWASIFSYCASYFGSLELVPRYCNNLYLNSVLFEVRNVFTSLLRLVIVSHLSPKGSGRFSTWVSDPGTYMVRIRFAFQNRVWQKWYQSLADCRTANLA